MMYFYNKPCMVKGVLIKTHFSLAHAVDAVAS